MLSWISGKGNTVEELIAQKQYDKAIDAIKAQLDERPKNTRLRLQMGDVLAMAERTEAAIKVMLDLAEEFATEGFTAKAVAILKKIQRLDPTRAGIDEKLADLIRARDVPVAIPSVAPPPRDVTIEAQAEVSSPDEGDAPVRSPLFDDFSREELLAVMNGLDLLTFEPGEIIMTEGETGASLLILTTGTVRAYVINASGANLEVRTMDEGEFFGEISLLSGKPRTATITAATPCELLELNRTTLDKISEDHPRVREIVQEFSEKRAGSIDEVMARST
ncbi:MAG: cyclic nucleotide-binding domain-containing protein [Acidobacteria bacterium]|nr:MAG: cyclic nucleotide-binding domain-containing protein [Acidobacteriota bacterium]